MSYFLFYFTVGIISFVTLWNRYNLKYVDFTPSVFAFMVECLKASIMYLTLRYYYKVDGLILFNKNIREYVSISFLYLISNILLFTILGKLSAGTFLVLSQHRIFWTVLLSKFLLNKKYSEYEIVSCIVNFSSVVLLIYEKLNETDISYVCILVLIHGFTGSLASVIIQKTMQSTGTELKNYCVESFQIYLAGLPVYGLWILIFEDDIQVPTFTTLIPMVLFTSIQGMFIGAIFKYYSALHRIIMQSMVLVIVMLVSKLLIDRDEKLNDNFYGLSFIILCSVIIFTMNRIYKWILVSMFLLILYEYIKKITVVK